MLHISFDWRGLDVLAFLLVHVTSGFPLYVLKISSPQARLTSCSWRHMEITSLNFHVWHGMTEVGHKPPYLQWWSIFLPVLHYVLFGSYGPTSAFSLKLHLLLLQHACLRPWPFLAPASPFSPIAVGCPSTWQLFLGTTFSGNWVESSSKLDGPPRKRKQLACGFKYNHYLETDCPASFTSKSALPSSHLNDVSSMKLNLPILSNTITFFLSQTNKSS